MFKPVTALFAFIMLAGLGIAVAAWPRASAASDTFASEGQLMLAYAKVHDGMPVAKAASPGFNPGRARRLSVLALMENFMPKDSFSFDTLDPKVQACFEGRPGCDAYDFPVASGRAQAVILVAGDAVVWKSVSGVHAVEPERAKRVARK